MNIKNILVPVDFSPPSRLALNHAITLARQFRARLTLMHVVESAPVIDPFETKNERVDNDQREQALRMLGAMVAPEDQDDLDLRVILKSGDIKSEILAAVREDASDLVVIGTHGRGLFCRWAVGSVAEGLLRNLSIPVLTVCRATKPLSMKRILFATDLSEDARKGFVQAMDWARTTRSTLFILHVVDPTTLTYGDVDMVTYVSKFNMNEAKSRVAELVAEAARAKVKVESTIVEGGAAENILRFATESDADLILMTVHKKGFVERALQGTTAEHVVREATVPVLSIPLRPKAAKRTDKSKIAKAS